MTLARIVEATGGRLTEAADGATVVDGPVVSDSGQARAGALFVAIRGARVDGHDFAGAALAAGAVAVLGTRDLGLPGVVVDDALTALGRLAHAVTDALPDMTIVAITGSSGKTTTKDLVASVLSGSAPSSAAPGADPAAEPDSGMPQSGMPQSGMPQSGMPQSRTIAPPGSFNNELGLPLTALRATGQTRHLVLEMGARGPGHLAYLCGVVRPDIGVVLNVGTAHLGEFGGRDAIAAAKGELPEALPATGVAVLNADDPLVDAMSARTSARVVWFGESERADVRATDVRLGDDGRPRFRLHARGVGTDVALRLRGAHQVTNALAAAAVGLECGMEPGAVAAALGAAEPASRWRMEITERPDGVTVINDAYNANPDSVRAALKTLVAMSDGRRSWAVLGAMGELGEASDTEHEGIGRLVVRLGVGRLVVMGEAAARMHMGAVLEGSWGEESVLVPDIRSAAELLRRELRAGDVVLVKASRAVGSERLALDLADAPARGSAPARGTGDGGEPADAGGDVGGDAGEDAGGTGVEGAARRQVGA